MTLWPLRLRNFWERVRTLLLKTELELRVLRLVMAWNIKAGRRGNGLNYRDFRRLVWRCVQQRELDRGLHQ